MKKICLILLVLTTGAQAQFYENFYQFNHLVKKHTANRITPQIDTLKAGGGGVAVDTLWTIRGTRSDTSRFYRTSPYMNLWHRFTQASSDSVHYKIVRFVAPETEYAAGKLPPYSEFVRLDSVVVTRTGTQENPQCWQITGSPIPAWRWHFFVISGLSENKKALPGCTGRLKLANWGDHIRAN